MLLRIFYLRFPNRESDSLTISSVAGTGFTAIDLAICFGWFSGNFIFFNMLSLSSTLLSRIPETKGTQK